MRSVEEENQRIQIVAGPLRFFSGKTCILGEGRIEFQLQPSPKTILSISGNSEKHPDIICLIGSDANKGKVALLEFGQEIEILITHVEIKSEYLIRGTINGPQIIGDVTRKYAEARSLLLNYTNFLARPMESKSEFEPLRLAAPGWIVELHKRADSDLTFQRLREEGGFGVTHDLVIRRDKDLKAEYPVFDNIFDILSSFFSFSRGLRCIPALRTLHSSDANTLRVLGAPETTAWRSCFSWFDPCHSEMLKLLFPLFVKAMDGPLTNYFRDAIYWYNRSNSSEAGLDGSLILSQAALELLAWVYLVHQTKTLSNSKFKRLKAFEQISALLQKLSIPTAVPPQLCSLIKINHEGPEALTTIRNAMVHPNNRDPLGFKEIFEIWNLSLWYIELSLLAIFGYRGMYSSRINSKRWSGDIHPVPWSI